MKNGEIEMKYNPNPMQTDDITLSDDLVALTELIAANVHDVWLLGVLKRGGLTERLRMLIRKPLLALYRMTNCLSLKKSMTVILRWKHSS